MGRTHENIENFDFSMLPKATKVALDYLSSQDWLGKSKWYLAGGTALAMHFAHRRSVDLDFFLPKPHFAEGVLVGHFHGKDWTTDILREGTVYGRLLGAKVSFIAYPFFLPKEPKHRYGNIRVLDAKDIAVMKIIAISQRGRKRDFIDLYWYVTHIEPLLDVLKRLPEQYPTVVHDYHHILKSLVYFVDAEEDIMPNMTSIIAWKTVKNYFQKTVHGLVDTLVY